MIRRSVFSIACLVFLLLGVLGGACFLGLAVGSTSLTGFSVLGDMLFSSDPADPMMADIVWRIRFPRVLMALMAGAVLSTGGLVFQALLRNPLAEPYILGVSGGSAIGAIIGIILGFSRFPGVGLTAFIGSMATLVLVIVMSAGKVSLKKDAMLLSGVVVNSFCSAIIMFLISLTQNSKIHNIMFWLMGDLSSSTLFEAGILAVCIVPCFLVIFFLSHAMNLLLMGKDMASSMGVNIQVVTWTLLVSSSFMVSAAVCQCGLMGFVGLVVPHIFRLALGPDHRVLVPACILGGGAYMVICDLLARWIPSQGEIPVGVITAMIGAPLFIILLKKGRA
ncbi:MAG: iron ABC transporter permease [Thermodesulfobacteriota bacterium]|nr:iron ABC transporter permease [Thermodesulfobacteriota bacterium]